MVSVIPLYVAGVCLNFTDYIGLFGLGLCDAIGSPIWVTGRTRNVFVVTQKLEHD